MSDAGPDAWSDCNGEVAKRQIRATSSRRSFSLPKSSRSLPGRKLTDSVVRSSSGMDYGFSSDIVEPVTKRARDQTQESVAVLKDLTNKPSSVRSLLTLLFSCVYSLVISAIIIFMFLLAASFALEWMKSRCEFLHELRYDVNAFRQNFTSTIIGQPFASESIPLILADFQTKKHAVPHIVWCVGWTGVGKSKSLNLIQKHLSKEAYVHYVLPSLLPDTSHGLEQYTSTTIMNLNSCLKNIVIVDGWDEKYDDTTVKFLSGLISGIKVKAKEIPNMSQLLVFIAGTRSGEVINRKYLALRQLGDRREEIPVQNFTDAISRTEDYKLINAIGPVTVIPFLPMEAEQVMECARKEMMHILPLLDHAVIVPSRKDFHAKSQEEIMQRLLEYLPLLSSKNLIIPSTGCKKVFSALTYLLENE